MMDSNSAQGDPPLLVGGQNYPLWSPDQAYDAAAVLLGMLEAERTERADFFGAGSSAAAV